MNYVVIVNNKFIVNGIESTSAGGAEHKILDNYNGIAGAQAFALNELGTDCFAGFCESCETISLRNCVKNQIGMQSCGKRLRKRTIAPVDATKNLTRSWSL